MAEWLYGRHAVEEALKAGGRKVHRVLLAEPSGSEKGSHASRFTEIERTARSRKIPVETVPSQRLESISRAGHHHQGVVAEVSAFPYTSMSAIEELCRAAGNEAIVLFLDSIQDPQNFGTLLRSADAVGVTAVVML